MTRPGKHPLYVCQIGDDPPFIDTAPWGAKVLAACIDEESAEAACRLFRTPIHVYRFGRWMKRD
jgi:hypothetical protein